MQTTLTQIYTDTDNGFSIQYPGTWVVEKGSDITNLENPPAVAGYLKSTCDSNVPTSLQINIGPLTTIFPDSTLEEFRSSLSERNKLDTAHNIIIEDAGSDFRTTSLLHGYKAVESFTDSASHKQAHVITFYFVLKDKTISIAFIALDTDYYANMSTFTEMALSFKEW